MFAHRIVVVLIFFSLAGLVLINSSSSAQDQQDDQAEGNQSASVDLDLNAVETASESADRALIVYYFHGNKRCRSCRKIEMFTHEALLSCFKDQLESQRIVWQLVNIDNPKNKHFIDDFELFTKSVVLVDMQNDKMLRWKNLKDVWRIKKEKETFREYISAEVTAFLTGD